MEDVHTEYIKLQGIPASRALQETARGDWWLPAAEEQSKPVKTQNLLSECESTCSPTDYFREMAKYRFGSCKLSPVPQTSPDVRRVNTEMRSLATDLPCEAAAAVFVKVDESSLHHMQALISGVEDTPYAHGLFLFDIVLPDSYPAVPPRISLLTTGNSTVRFNPNLYTTGYLCLSILNTWAGAPEEKWRPNYSTLFQIFVSIQSIVMTSKIANQEPSYQSLAENAIENVEYGWIVRYQTIVWGMIDMIRHPPPGFEEVVRNHFRIKRATVLKDVEQWVSASSSVSSFNSSLASSQNSATVQKFRQNGLTASLRTASNELRDELGRL